MIVIKSDFSEILQTYKAASLKVFRTAVHHGFMDFLADVKTEAIKELLPGPRVHQFGRTRREVYKSHPATTGRLTNRTGRLAMMLADGKKGDLGCTGIGTKLARTKAETSRSFVGTVTHDEHYFYGRWSPYVRDDSPALRGVAGSTIESQITAKRQVTLKQSMHMRAMHEHGLKGKAPRMYLSRSYMRLRNYYSIYAEPYLARYFNGK
jgi:hypothetical protein